MLKNNAGFKNNIRCLQWDKRRGRYF